MKGPRYWSRCVAVRVTDTHFQRALACQHEQPIRPLEYLTDTARSDPQQMVGHRFYCKACAAQQRFSGPEPPTEAA